MPTSDLTSVSGLIRRGLFKDALASLQANQPSRQESRFKEHQSLLADTFQLLGDNARADEIASRLLNTRDVSTQIVIRCHLVVGNVRSEERRVGKECRS